MENQGTTATSEPLGMCEKVFNALKIPLLQPLRRRISYKQETAAAQTAYPKPPAAADSGQGRPKVSTNPVSLHTQVQAKGKATGKAQAPALTAPAAGGAHGKPAKVEPTPLPAAKPDKERAGIENINDRVVDYINRAKVKLRAGSTVGRPGKNSSG
ncbi:hypothetical protein ACLOJK_025909 [Asimina triloba]